MSTRWKATRSIWPPDVYKRQVLVDGSFEQVKAEVENIIDGFGSKGFILGADCTLPTEIDYARIRCAVDAAAKHSV